MTNYILETVRISCLVNNLTIKGTHISKQGITIITLFCNVDTMALATLLSYIERQAGEYHRGTVRYDGDETDVMYLREDVKKTRLTSQIDEMLERLRPEASVSEQRAFPFGDLNATVRLFDEAILVHFPVGTDRGIVVSLEPEVARDLNAFIEGCLKRV